MAFVATATAAVVLRSYWALWIGSLTGVVVSVVLFWKSSGWRPNTRPSFRGAGEMVRFGGKVSVANMVNFLIRNADNVLIGRVSGPAQLGLYDRSYKLMMLPLVNISGPLGQVMLPALGRLRDDGEAYRRAFLTAVRTLQLVLVPGAAVAAATSDRMIPFLLGPRWSAASDIFFWLSLTGLIQPLPNTMGWLFITSGRVGEQLRWNIFSAAVTLAGFAVGIRYGAVGVAASLFFTAAVRVPILFWYAGIGTSVRAYDLYRSMREPYLAGAAAFYLAHKLSPYLPTGPLLLAGLLAGYVLAILLFLATRDGRSLLKTIIRLCASGLRGFARGADR
jgi:PST family polysaccharide transporter